MHTPIGTPAKALAAALGLAVTLIPAATGVAAKKAPAKHGTVKGCVLKKKAKCKKAKLTKVKVGKVNLAGTNLAGATITGATFSGTNLSGVSMKGATITDTTFTNVKVGNLDLSGSRLSNVKFTGATGGGQSAQAREADCIGTDAGASIDDASWYTCSGGGVDMANASVTKNVIFTRSVIPYSTFRGMTAASGGHSKAYLLGFNSTDAHASDFFGAKLGISTGSFSGAAGPTNVSGSMFDGAGIYGMTDTNASRASFLGTQWAVWTPGDAATDNVDFTGARGLQGATTVRVNATADSDVTAVNIHEDGAWRIGVLCNPVSAGTCADTSVAVGAPVVAIAGSPLPIEMVAPDGWTCTRVAGSGDTPFRARCDVAAATPGDVVLGVHPYVAPVVTRQVTVQSLLGGGGAGRPANIWIDVLDGAGGVASTTTCVSASTCSTAVANGTRVQVRMQQSWEAMGTSGWFDIWCPGEPVGDVSTSHMSQQVSVGANPWEVTTGYTCPAYAVTADTSATAWAS